ncbi:MAG: acyl-CoA dehydrogenase family protein [Thermoleophilaceae bacterium]
MVSAPVDTVIRPDFSRPSRHFIFTEEHEALRESIASFVAKELRPHAEEWEETTFPDSVFTRMGELGFLGLSYPEEYGGQGGDYYASLVLAEELAKADCGGLGMGIAVHTDMATPPIHLFGTEEQKQRYLVPSIRGREDLVPGHHRARRRLGRIRAQDPRGPRRRRVGDQRVEDLHHQRHARRLHRPRDEDRPRGRLRRLHAVHRRHRRCRDSRWRVGSRSSACTPRTPRCSP